jgi:hypothetical protein
VLRSEFERAAGSGGGQLTKLIIIDLIIVAWLAWGWSIGVYRYAWAWFVVSLNVGLALLINVEVLTS